MLKASCRDQPDSTHQVPKKHLWNLSMESPSQASQPNPLLWRQALGTPFLRGGFPLVCPRTTIRFGTQSEFRSTLNSPIPPLHCNKQQYNNWYRCNRQRRSAGVSTIVLLLRGRCQGGVIIVLPIQGWRTGRGIHVPSPLCHIRKCDGGSTHPRRRSWRMFGVRNRNENFLRKIHQFHASNVPWGWR